MDAERETVLENVLLESELPGDIPLKSREFMIPYSLSRLAYLIRIVQQEGIDCLELVQNLFPRKRMR